MVVPFPGHMAATLPLREALNEGIASGTFIDTKIILFSRRDTSGRVYARKALYANSHVLRSVPYFNDLLFGNFIESESQDFDNDFDNHDESEDEYDYDSDSDLEDDGEIVANALRGARDKADPLKETMTEAIRKVPPPKYTLKRVLRSGPQVVRCLKGENFRSPSYEKRPERPKKGKVVKLRDMAFITFQAFLFYLYTGEIQFAPMRSRVDRNWGARLRNPFRDVPRPSPRSVYRLSDKYDVPELKDLALSRIRAELENCDVVRETFSRFASKHEEIREIYVSELVSIMLNDQRGKVRSRVEAIIDRHSRGDLVHAADALSLLWSKSTQRDDAAIPLRAAAETELPVQLPPVNPPTNWKSVKTTIVKSMKHGVFFDQKYWARESKDGDVLKPVYFSSLIAHGVLWECILQSDGREAVPTRPTENDVESDYEVNPMSNTLAEIEEEPTPAVEKSQDHEEEEGLQGRAVLTSGSYTAWRSLLFYLCTDEISFAPLRSQGEDLRRAYISNNASVIPPPCSPKSIYALARLLGLRSLCQLSFRDIEGKLSEDNIVEEFSSHVSSTYPEIREMESRLLFSRFHSEATNLRMQEKFATAGASRSAHRADSLKLGLRSALDLKRRESLSLKGVFLRCKEQDCPGNRTYTSYPPAEAVNNEFCRACFRVGRSRPLFCVGCQQQRKARETQCQHCGKEFVLVVSDPS